VSGIAIYVEGGGDGAQQKASLRRGFDSLLGSWKERARSRRLAWKVVCAGDGRAAFEAWRNSLATAGPLRSALLVDSEGPLAGRGAAARRDHLSQRGWNLADAPVESLHLMVQCMEAWIVADPDAVVRFYGQSFLANALSRRQNLEEEPKAELSRQLEHATRQTQKGPYHKIRHASELLTVIDPSRIALRCAHFGVFTRWLDAAIEGA
jgi:hypothetical protein